MARTFVDKAPLIAELAELEATFEAATDEEVAQSDADAIRLTAIFSDMDAIKNDEELRVKRAAEFKSLDVTLSNMRHNIVNYRKTIAADLVYIDTRFVICDTNELQSPAGFHPDTRVYIQPTICIMTNDPKERGPRHCNRTLYKYDLKTEFVAA